MNIALATRRSFLASVAAVGSASLFQACPAAAKGRGWRAPSVSQRRRLANLAHFGPKPAAEGKRGLAITTHPLATQAAVDMLRAGGNAVDAICAASLTQTVVEPHMTTITGVFSILYFDAKTQTSFYLNGTNNAPLNFANFQMSQLGEALSDGRGVTTPGWWAGFEGAMKRWGTLPLRQVMAPAIHYAREGFEVHPFLWGEAFQYVEKIAQSEQGREVYLPKGTLVRPGEPIYQKRYADLLDRLAEEGSDYYYRGRFAENFAAVVQAAGGYITRTDFLAYRPIWAEPVRSRYRGHDLVAAPFPDYGGNNLAEILNVLDKVDLKALGPAFESPQTALTLYRIMDMVYGDAARRHSGQSKQTVEEALSPEVAEERFMKLRLPPARLSMHKTGSSLTVPGSNHLTVVDEQGNVATVLHSVMSLPWSNGLFVEGASICAAAGHYPMGLPKPGGRLFSRIAPNIFLKDGQPVLASGSPSVSLMENIVQNSTNILDFGIPIEESVMKPRFGAASPFKAGKYLAERDLGDSYIKTLVDGGVDVDLTNGWSWWLGSFDGISIDSHRAAHARPDPRRSGLALAA
jgi:gamma-glutamyltranspeptidase/glutathione hydrolase